jgi:hypothetical protein
VVYFLWLHWKKLQVDSCKGNNPFLLKVKKPVLLFLNSVFPIIIARINNHNLAPTWVSFLLNVSKSFKSQPTV